MKGESRGGEICLQIGRESHCVSYFSYHCERTWGRKGWLGLTRISVNQVGEGRVMELHPMRQQLLNGAENSKRVCFLLLWWLSWPKATGGGACQLPGYSLSGRDARGGTQARNWSSDGGRTSPTYLFLMAGLLSLHIYYPGPPAWSGTAPSELDPSTSRKCPTNKAIGQSDGGLFSVKSPLFRGPWNTHICLNTCG